MVFVVLFVVGVFAVAVTIVSAVVVVVVDDDVCAEIERFVSYHN